MKKLIVNIVVISLLSTEAYSETIMANENEIICNNKYDLEYILDELAVTKEWTERRAAFMASGCDTVNEGTDLKILKTKILKLKNDKKHTKALLVKLQNGSTAYIAR